MSDSDDEIVQPAARRDAEVCAPRSERRPRAQQQRPVRARPEGRDQGPIKLAVVLGLPGIDHDGEVLQQAASANGLPPHPEGDSALAAVLGIVALRWVFRGLSHQCDEAIAMRKLTNKKRYRADPWANLDYEVTDSCHFANVVWIGRDRVRAELDTMSLATVMAKCNPETVMAFQSKHQTKISGWHGVPLEMGLRIVNGSWHVLHSVPLLQRCTKRITVLRFCRPMPRDYNNAKIKLASSQVAQTQTESEPHFIPTSAPPARATERFDPARTLRFIDYTRFLKDLKEIPKASERCMLAHWPEHAHDMLKRLQSEGFSYPSRWTLERGRARLDVVSMLLTRRQLEQARNADTDTDRSMSIHIYCDASPISGQELFGAQFDIYNSLGLPESLQPRQLPGPLQYGPV